MKALNEDWLSLTNEAILEPDMPICDPHHHFWTDRTIFKPHDWYLLPELASDIGSGHNVRSTVLVEARAMYRSTGPMEMQPVGEVEFADHMAIISTTGKFGTCKAAAAIVGHADLSLGVQVGPILDALLLASPTRLHGIRHCTIWHSHPALSHSFFKTEHLLGNEMFRVGARQLLPRKLSFDAWLYFNQLPELIEFAKAIPELTIILNHVGGPVCIGPYADNSAEVFESWRESIRSLAKCSNVYIKLGGLGLAHTGFGWHERAKPIGSEELATSMSPYISHCIESFGPDRCMFESNFPVDKLSYSYHVLFNAFKRLSKHYSSLERAALFHDTAVRMYRIDA